MSKRQQQIRDIEVLLSEKYPTLHVAVERGECFIRGLFPARLEGVELDHYLVEIHIPRNYPKAIPLIREIAGRIPVQPDWHVNGDGFLCLCVPDEEWKYLPPKWTILDFLNSPVNHFFLSHIYRKIYKIYPFGERSHGLAGIIEYYSEELETQDIQVILQFLKYLSKDKPKGHWLCYCGSNKPMLECHFAKMTEMHEKVSPAKARLSFKRLNTYLSPKK